MGNNALHEKRMHVRWRNTAAWQYFTTILTKHTSTPCPSFMRRRSIADIFRIQVISNTDVRSPIITLGSTSFFHVRHENLYIVALTKWNANAALIFEFCYRFINIGRSYFGKLDEEAVKANFVLIYELLDGTLCLRVCLYCQGTNGFA